LNSRIATFRNKAVPVAMPAAGLLAWLLLGKSEALLAGIALSALLVGCVLVAVHHAEDVAHRLGEPFGTLVLTISVTVIEVALIISMMLNGEPNPELVRDTMHAVVVLVLHGVAGLCIVAGTLRHREQEFSTAGASAFLSVLIPMVVLVLILPNYTTSKPGPHYTNAQLIFVSLACLALYTAFLFTLTVRHRDYFVWGGENQAHSAPSAGNGWAAFVLLVLTLSAVVLLAKSLAPFIEDATSFLGAPDKLNGLIVAAIVLLPETLAAFQAARNNRLQTSINLALGSAVASIGLTLPAVAALAVWVGHPLALGTDSGSTALLGLSFLMAMLTYGQGRTNLLSGFVHLVLLACFIFLIFVP